MGMGMMDSLRILLTGTDRDGYRYTAGHRLRILISYLSVGGLLISLYAAIRRSFEGQIDSHIPPSIESVEYSIRVHVRNIAVGFADLIYKAMMNMINNAWAAVAFFGIIIILLLLTKR